MSIHPRNNPVPPGDEDLPTQLANTRAFCISSLLPTKLYLYLNKCRALRTKERAVISFCGARLASRCISFCHAQSSLLYLCISVFARTTQTQNHVCPILLSQIYHHIRYKTNPPSPTCPALLTGIHQAVIPSSTTSVGVTREVSQSWGFLWTELGARNSTSQQAGTPLLDAGLFAGGASG